MEDKKRENLEEDKKFQEQKEEVQKDQPVNPENITSSLPFLDP